MTQPSIGRIVHYVSGVDFTVEDGIFETCHAAIVTEVADDHIGLCAFNPTGSQFRRDVKYADAEQHHAGTWHWPERV